MAKRETTAKTKQDVDEMNSSERLWDSLSYSYDQKKEEVGKEYDKAISQQDRALQQRGMQRSSYGAQTRANMLDKKAEAIGNVESEKIADYENRRTQAEQQDLENERWERQFAAQQEQNDWQREFSEKQYAANREDTAWQQGMTEKQYDASRADTAWQQGMTEKQYAASREDADWQKQFQTHQYTDSRADADWQKQFQTQQYADSRADTEWSQTFQREQWEAQQAQWREQFEYSKMTADQQLNYNYVMQALANGGDVSEDMLAKAGLSRADFNAMKQQKTSGSGTGKSGIPEWQRLGFSGPDDPRYLAYLAAIKGPKDEDVEIDAEEQNGPQYNPRGTITKNDRKTGKAVSNK